MCHYPPKNPIAFANFEDTYGEDASNFLHYAKTTVAVKRDDGLGAFRGFGNTLTGYLLLVLGVLAFALCFAGQMRNSERVEFERRAALARAKR